MTNFANASLMQQIDGLSYSVGVPLTATEADLNSLPSQPNYDPLAVRYCRSFIASVLFAVQGTIPATQVYVVAQTATDTGVNWLDVAWAVATLTTGTALFTLSGGQNQANSVQQTRQAGVAPSANGSNAFPLGGLLRFVGKAALLGQSSSSPGPSQVTVSINVKLQGLR